MEKGIDVYCNFFDADLPLRAKNFKPHDYVIDTFKRIDGSDILFVILNSESKSEGMILEIGYAIAKNIPIVIAVKEGITNTYLPGMATFSLTWENEEDLLEKISTIDFPAIKLMKDDRMAGHSDLYKEKSLAYEKFSQAEDSHGEVVKFLTNKVAGKIVLDFGCGTGKFIPELSSVAEKVIAVDINESQLDIAKKKSQNLKNVEFYKSEKDTIPLPDVSIDVVFAAWVIGSIHDLDVRAKIINEFKNEFINDIALMYIF